MIEFIPADGHIGGAESQGGRPFAGCFLECVVMPGSTKRTDAKLNKTDRYFPQEYPNADEIAEQKRIQAEILAEKNREALMRLEVVIGAVGTEDVLDRVFGEFCIGK